MKKARFIIITAGLITGFFAPAFPQVEIIERLPDDSYVANWEPVFRKKIVSYVQLPGDYAEYKKVKVYVTYRPKPHIGKEEEMFKYKDLTRQRYLGAELIRTGRTFSKLLDDSVLAVENASLTTEDQLLNNEMASAQ